MKHEPVKSRAITSIAYEDGRLQVKFNSGKTHEYPNVPADLHARFMAAESKGKFFAQHIRPKSTGKEVK